jgi:hypothetical protein
MGDPPFFLADLSQPLGLEAPPISTLLLFCSSSLLLTNSLKSDPELSVFHLDWSIFLHIILLLGGTQKVHVQES